MPGWLQGPAGETQGVFPISSPSSSQTLLGWGEPAAGGDGAATRCLSRGVWMDVGVGGRALGACWGAANPLSAALSPQTAAGTGWVCRGLVGCRRRWGNQPPPGEMQAAPRQRPILALALIIPLSNQYNRGFARSYPKENTPG